jgi:ElaB/YqjD/DUF883 family membrane-anchored ribosome-binding protein
LTFPKVAINASELRLMAVSPQYQKLYEQWQAAEAKARAAEEAVAARLLNAIDHRLSPPGIDAWDESKQLRRQAERLLREFIAAVQVERSHNADARAARSEADHPRST